MTEPILRTATCRCGQVVFELTGDPFMAPVCCCNDCLAAAHYVDAKARAAGIDNISYLEPGNPQSCCNAVFDRAAIRLVQGGDLVRRFRLRPTSRYARTYTSCCYTTVPSIVGSRFVLTGIGSPFNFNTIQPPIPTDVRFRLLSYEAKRPKELPPDVPTYWFAPWWALCRVLFRFLFGTEPTADPATRSLLDDGDTEEIAGPDAYSAAGSPYPCKKKTD